MDSEIDPRLWAAIKVSYEQKNYTGAITDGVLFMSELIRNKSGLAADGVALVHQAFNNTPPKIRVNRLQTESEKDEQKGVASLLIGIYQSIRNPRSHDKFIDQLETVHYIISFLSYIVQTIDKSKSQFNINDFLEQVMDTHFVVNEQYAKLIIDEVPRRQLLDALIEVYRVEGETRDGVLNLLMEVTLERLNQNEIDDFFEILTRDFRSAQEESAISRTIRMVGPRYWNKLGEASRIRIENMILQDVVYGTYSRKEYRYHSGGFASELIRMLPVLANKERILEHLALKLTTSSLPHRDFVQKAFFPTLANLVQDPPDVLVAAIRERLKVGDPSVYDMVEEFKDLAYIRWYRHFVTEIQNFSPDPKLRSLREDDLPF